jgi:hypothetical protein
MTGVELPEVPAVETRIWDTKFVSGPEAKEFAELKINRNGVGGAILSSSTIAGLSESPASIRKR